MPGTNPKIHLSDLPDDVLEKIFSYLDSRDLVALSHVNYTFNQITADVFNSSAYQEKVLAMTFSYLKEILSKDFGKPKVAICKIFFDEDGLCMLWMGLILLTVGIILDELDIGYPAGKLLIGFGAGSAGLRLLLGLGMCIYYLLDPCGKRASYNPTLFPNSWDERHQLLDHIVSVDPGLTLQDLGNEKNRFDANEATYLTQLKADEMHPLTHGLRSHILLAFNGAVHRFNRLRLPPRREIPEISEVVVIPSDDMPKLSERTPLIMRQP